MDLGACLRNKSMRVRVLPSALFEYDSVAQMEPERRSTKAKVASSSLAGVTCFVGLVGYDSGPVNRQRRFESGTELSAEGFRA
jgi:hypothetical protein